MGEGMAKDYAKKVYQDKRWKKTRQAVLSRDNYLCQNTINGVKCEKPASEVHHIVYITPSNVNDPNITYNMDNLISLCWECHNNEHHKSETLSSGYMFDDNGDLVKVEMMNEKDSILPL